MGRPIPDDDEPLELPREFDADDEAAGLPEAEELAFAEISDGPEEVGLDTELGMFDAFEPAIDADDDISVLEDETLGELVAELDADGEESGWLEESEGSGEVWEDDVSEDEEEYGHNDGGLEGVDDPLVDGLSDDEESTALDDDGDGPFGDPLGDELLREIAREGAASERS